MTVPGTGDVARKEDAFRRAALFASGLLALRESTRLQDLLSDLARQTRAPIAGISVIDSGFCWLPALIGMDLERIPLEESFCIRVIGSSDPFAEPDLLAHPDYEFHPLVHGPQAIRAFAAVPLRGVRAIELGTVFVADRVARPDFDAVAIRTLEQAALRVMGEASAPHHMRRLGRTTVEGLEELIRQATRDGDDELVTAIDQVMREVLPLTGLRDV